MSRSAALRGIVYAEETDVSDGSTKMSTARAHETVKTGKFEVGDVVEIRQCELIDETTWMERTGKSPDEVDWANQMLVGTVRSTEDTCLAQ